MIIYGVVGTTNFDKKLKMSLDFGKLLGFGCLEVSKTIHETISNRIMIFLIQITNTYLNCEKNLRCYMMEVGIFTVEHPRVYLHFLRTVLLLLQIIRNLCTKSSSEFLISSSLRRQIYTESSRTR